MCGSRRTGEGSQPAFAFERRECTGMAAAHPFCSTADLSAIIVSGKNEPSSRRAATPVDPLPNVTRWLCVHARPRKEAGAERYCHDVLGFDTFYPRLKHLKTIRRVKRWIVGPLFPRYFFCRLNLAQNFRAVQYAPQVVGVVSFGGHPTPVDDSIIEQLQQWAGEAVDIVTVRPGFHPGDLVEIAD